MFRDRLGFEPIMATAESETKSMFKNAFIRRNSFLIG